jgi:hypothetical protein
MIMGTILVQLSDREWTIKAMHMACAMARSTEENVTLLHLMSVVNPKLLGTVFGVPSLSAQELEMLDDCERIAEDYGVCIGLQPVQYESLIPALVQAVEHTKASIVFADLAVSVFPVWKRFQDWNLRRQLASLGCELVMLEQPTPALEWVPTISYRPSK